MGCSWLRPCTEHLAPIMPRWASISFRFSASEFNGRRTSYSETVMREELSGRALCFRNPKKMLGLPSEARCPSRTGRTDSTAAGLDPAA